MRLFYLYSPTPSSGIVHIRHGWIEGPCTVTYWKDILKLVGICEAHNESIRFPLAPDIRSFLSVSARRQDEVQDSVLKLAEWYQLDLQLERISSGATHHDVRYPQHRRSPALYNPRSGMHICEPNRPP